MLGLGDWEVRSIMRGTVFGRIMGGRSLAGGVSAEAGVSFGADEVGGPERMKFGADFLILNWQE